MLTSQFCMQLCVQYNERIIASSSADSSVRIWDFKGNSGQTVHTHTIAPVIAYVPTGSCLHTLGEHLGLVRCLCLHGDRLVSGGDRKRINVWDVTVELRLPWQRYLPKIALLSVLTQSGQLLHTVHRQQVLLHLMCITDTQIITGSPDSGVISIIGYW